MWDKWLESRPTCSPVLRCVSEGDHNVLVNEDEEGQQEAQAHGADDVQSRQALERSQAEDRSVVDPEDWNWREENQLEGESVSQSMTQTESQAIRMKTESLSDSGIKIVN